jgi:large subunit ribosomal protein L23
MMDARNTIIKPLVTEKSMSKVADGRYSFAVSQYATKTQVKKAVESSFSVKVVAITTSVVKGKSKRAGTRRLEKLDQVWKKAIVTVKKGDRIYLFEAGAGDEPHVESKAKEEKKEQAEKAKTTTEKKGKKA